MNPSNSPDRTGPTTATVGPVPSRTDSDLLAEIVEQLAAINARLDRAETAAGHAGKLFAEHVAPFFQRLATNPKVARFLK